MHQRDLARLLVKIAGLVILIGALTSLPRDLAWLLSGRAEPNLSNLVLMVFAPAAISAGAGLILFWCVDPIVDRALFAKGQGSVSRSADDFRGIEELAIAVLGFYFFSTGLTEAAYYWGRADLYYRFIQHAPYGPPTFPATDFGGLSAAALRLIIGTVLMLGSRGLVALRRRLTALRPMSKMS